MYMYACTHTHTHARTYAHPRVCVNVQVHVRMYMRACTQYMTHPYMEAHPHVHLRHLISPLPVCHSWQLRPLRMCIPPGGGAAESHIASLVLVYPHTRATCVHGDVVCLCVGLCNVRTVYICNVKLGSGLYDVMCTLEVTVCVCVCVCVCARARTHTCPHVRGGGSLGVQEEDGNGVVGGDRGSLYAMHTCTRACTQVQTCFCWWTLCLTSLPCSPSPPPA